ncbi:MAG: hypothetical protein AMXMBFR49_05660 [Chlorobiota bacterium]
MKKNRNLAIFLVFAALVQVYVIYHFYQKSEKADREAIIDLKSEGFQRLSEGKYESALTLFGRVLDIDDRDTSALMFRGLAYQGMKKYGEAEKDFLHVLDIDSKKIDAMVLLGNLYFEKGENQKALESYLKAESTDAGNHLVPIHKAAYYLKLRMPDEAITELEKVQRLNPEFEYLQEYFGEAYFLKNDFNTAKIYLENSVSKNPGNQRSLLMLGSIMARTGDKKEACSMFEQALNSGATSAADSLSKYCK